MAAEERLEGELLGFTYRAADGAFAVGRLRPDRGLECTVVGPLGHLTEGQHLQLEGAWTDNPPYGRQFKVKRFLVEDPRTLKGLERYLSSGAVRGLGPEFARRVVSTFGLETLRIIDQEPERLREVKGIGPKRLNEIKEHWARDQEHRELAVMLRGYGIGAGLVSRIVDRYGRDALNVVTRDPYRLAAEVRGVGFRTADVIARSMGVAVDNPARIEAAGLYVLGEAEDEGHCFLPEDALLQRVGRLEIDWNAASEALDRLAGQGRVVRPDSAVPGRRPVYLPRLERAEARVARRALRLLHTAPPWPGEVAQAEAALGLTLNNDQRRAVVAALQAGLSAITGGPGTGKTTIVRVLVAAGMAAGQRWLLAAPTGRAARRLQEATGQEARTLHRLLEFQVKTGRFGRNHELPLDADGVLIDEASMVDLPMLDALLAAVPAGCRVVLVGDADQLPSVGPGHVLADLIDSGAVPVATLREVYRQARDSAIVRNAHRINQGQMPISAEREPDDQATLRPDFFLVHRDDPLEAQALLLRIVQERLPHQGMDPRRDVQVLTPMHNGVLGTEALNTLLQDALNPARHAAGALYSSAQGAEIVRGGRRLRVGDRVVQSRNNYDLGIFNGDTGRIIGVDEVSVEVDFEGHTETLKGEQLSDIDLCWAMSIHKSQGSEYPAVIVVLHRSHRVMLRRNLLYTAITRARRFCCVIGDRWALEEAVRQRGGEERWTRLSDRLRAAEQERAEEGEVRT